VYRARQISLERVVAVKAPHWAATLDPRERARFWREAQAIARLRHPGIVPLFAVGQRSGTPFLVLELVEGRPLSEVIQRLKTGALPRTGASLGREGVSFEIAAAGLAIEILAALQAAHEAGIVHRDVKPGNVMLESSGRVRVLDFGLAKMQKDEQLTRSREFLGTIQFTAPEVLDDPRSAGPSSDTYSVGVLLYELLSL
jgi:serine/threonine protein kinase